MVANEDKYPAIIVGNTDYEFSFHVEISIEIFGMAIDDALKFEHISMVCKKVNNQFNVILRFRKLISLSTMLKLYKASILLHFNYCFTI